MKMKMKMKMKIIIGGLPLMMLWVGQAFAIDGVVVIPLTGAAGNAEVGDVLTGKTFSNSNQEGITGTRPPAPVAKTGQTESKVLGDDGNSQKGESWPSPRFTAGPVFAGHGFTDYLTGLVWEVSPSGTLRDWAATITHCNSLITGSGSIIFYDWRLPNIKELLSLVDYSNKGPALPTGHPFIGIISDGEYWSSTTHADSTTTVDLAWTMFMDKGEGNAQLKSFRRLAWCVRGPF